MATQQVYFQRFFNLQMLPMADDHLLRLLQLTDTTLPIGGFSHSAGLETYVQLGIVKDRQTAKEFVVAQLEQNIFYTDAALVSLSYDAAEEKNWIAICRLDEECTAVKLPKEIRQASQKLGLRLLKIFQPVAPGLNENEYVKAIRRNEVSGHYSIVFGLCASILQINKLNALKGFYYNNAAAMVMNSVKLVPLGQQDGQEILFSLHDVISTLAERSLEPNRELIGLCCAGFDIRCMQHEELYSRLYMS
jgi:urease accessory protein